MERVPRFLSNRKREIDADGYVAARFPQLWAGKFTEASEVAPKELSGQPIVAAYCRALQTERKTWIRKNSRRISGFRHRHRNVYRALAGSALVFWVGVSLVGATWLAQPQPYEQLGTAILLSTAPVYTDAALTNQIWGAREDQNIEIVGTALPKQERSAPILVRWAGRTAYTKLENLDFVDTPDASFDLWHAFLPDLTAAGNIERRLARIEEELKASGEEKWRPKLCEFLQKQSGQPDHDKAKTWFERAQKDCASAAWLDNVRMTLFPPSTQIDTRHSPSQPPPRPAVDPELEEERSLLDQATALFALGTTTGYQGALTTCKKLLDRGQPRLPDSKVRCEEIQDASLMKLTEGIKETKP